MSNAVCAWECKICFARKYSRTSLWVHMKSRHAVHAPKKMLPCLHCDCIYSFRSMSALSSHISRYHPNENRKTIGSKDSLSCIHCAAIHSSVQGLVIHLRMHVRENVTVLCPAKGCMFKTNIIGTFSSHLSKKHGVLAFECIKYEYRGKCIEGQSDDDIENEADCSAVTTADDCMDASCTTINKDDPNCTDDVVEIDIINEISLFFMKMECVHGVSRSAMQNIISDLNRLTDLSGILMKQKIKSVLSGLEFPLTLEDEVYKIVMGQSLFKKYTENGCLFSTAWRRNVFIHSNYAIVDPVEYNLGYIGKKLCTFTYVPMLDVLRNLLKMPQVLKHVLESRNEGQNIFSSYKAGTYFKQNALYSSVPFSIQLGLYYDDFEVANPLGTSRGNYKMAGFYWTIANLPAELRACIDNIQLAVLCKTSHMQHFGVDKLLQQLLKDIATLESEGIYVEVLGAQLQGSISFVAADNLAAHMLFGMCQSFGPNVNRFCRYCLATNKESLQNYSGNAEPFQLRTPANYLYHVKQVVDGTADLSMYGIKNDSVFHGYLKYFHVTEGFPPDISHDLLEGIVPYELALCIGIFIEKKYFLNIKQMNEIMSNMIYLYTDSVNKPQPIPSTAVTKKSIGGNATENRTFLRLFPIVFGTSVPDDEPCWALIRELKELVELSFAPALHVDDIVAFESKIQSHNASFVELFPNERRKPKHHFVSHYADMTYRFGPLVQYNTLRFESKHAFFKHIIHDCKNFKNVTKMLAMRHQLLQCYLSTSGNIFQQSNTIVHGGTYVPLSYSPTFEMLLQSHFPGMDSVLLMTGCKFRGIEYRSGLYVIDGFACGLPTFCKIHAVVAHGNTICLLCVSQESSYNEHLHSYEVVESSVCHVHQFSDLKDYYPLPGYNFKSKTYVTLKHFVSWRLLDNMSVS